jgi:F-box/TPR repeat protein Pof3
VWEQCEITLAAAQLVLSTCQKSLAEASFMRVLGTRGGFIADRWPKLDSLRSIYLKGHRDSCLDLVISPAPC